MMESEWKQMEKDERKQEFESRDGRRKGRRRGGLRGGEGGRPAAVENLFTSHTQPGGEAERVPFIQTQQQLRCSWRTRVTTEPS